MKFIKEIKVNDLIEFDESDQINKREPENIFDAFIKEDLINFEYAAEELVMNNNSGKVNDTRIKRVNEVVNSLVYKL
ncbi:12188_t:CDS:2 [Dentiscutata erythropus]|uniref:12188_t:CDS:1 n=1 Tax=Dentiscutata erythropus TaxID=1348616 RepID=A0A9N9IIH9_9GLOM|nr:12188_t:CDS:2 [Dentiscutata erythropus]